MWQSRCYGNSQKTNLWQFFLQCWRLQNLIFNGTGLHQRYLHETFKDNNLVKLLTKVNLLDVSISCNLLKQTSTLIVFQAEKHCVFKSNQIPGCVNALSLFQFFINRKIIKKTYQNDHVSKITTTDTS